MKTARMRSNIFLITTPFSDFYGQFVSIHAPTGCDI